MNSAVQITVVLLGINLFRLGDLGGAIQRRLSPIRYTAALVPTSFRQLNEGWNAEPNAPNPRVEVQDGALFLRFGANYMQFPDFAEDEELVLQFENPSRWRMGTVNDEGWYLDQGRFGRRGHSWGEFYEVVGDLLLAECPDDWRQIPDAVDCTRSHFLFYFRDEEFECDAAGWKMLRAAV